MCFQRRGIRCPGLLDAAGHSPCVICQDRRSSKNSSFRELMKETTARRRTARDEGRNDLLGMENRGSVRGVQGKADGETLFRREDEPFKSAPHPIAALDERRAAAIVKHTGCGNWTECARDADQEIR